jgi:hypothetical protein
MDVFHASRMTDPTIETARGALPDARADQILAFWSENGALHGDAARRRLRDVVCLLIDAQGAVAGVNSVYAADVALVGGRRFWVYRALLPGAAAAHADAMLATAFDALAGGFDPASDDPIGLCLLTTDVAEARRRPQAEWERPRMVHAGFTPDGAVVRVGYFDGARIA